MRGGGKARCAGAPVGRLAMGVRAGGARSAGDVSPRSPVSRAVGGRCQGEVAPASPVTNRRRCQRPPAVPCVLALRLPLPLLAPKLVRRLAPRPVAAIAVVPWLDFFLSRPLLALPCRYPLCRGASSSRFPCCSSHTLSASNPSGLPVWAATCERRLESSSKPAARRQRRRRRAGGGGV